MFLVLFLKIKTEAEQLHQWNPKSEIVIIDGANHVFGTHHPWEKETLSSQLNEVIKLCIAFLLP